MTFSLVLRFSKIFWLALLLMALLGVQRCTERLADRMTSCAPAPAGHELRAVLPVSYLMPVSSRQWLPLADTARRGGLDHLRRKASPRSRWLPAQPAYLPPLHRRPRQHLLDSLAAASMRGV
jgi:hypothetical protein